MKTILLLIQNERSRNKNQNQACIYVLIARSSQCRDRIAGRLAVVYSYVCAYAHKIIHHSNIHECTHALVRAHSIHIHTHTYTYTHIHPWAARQFYLWNATAPKQHFRPISIPPLFFLTHPFFLFRSIFGVFYIFNILL